MPGLEPGSQKTLDCWVEPGNDRESNECVAALVVEVRRKLPDAHGLRRCSPDVRLFSQKLTWLLLAYSQTVGVAELLAQDLFDPGDRLIHPARG
jgi:hypothetical protein